MRNEVTQPTALAPGILRTESRAKVAKYPTLSQVLLQFRLEIRTPKAYASHYVPRESC